MPAGRGLAAVAAGLACAAGLAAGSPAHAATRPGPLAVPSASLCAVSADSASDAWAVGQGYSTVKSEYTTLTEHWNGTSWARVASPNPGGTLGTSLYGVSATSPTDAWAVGSAYLSALILHWNGTKWSKAVLPPLTGNSGLTWVSADSATDAWALGFNNNSVSAGSMLLHWDGTTWSQVAIPSGVTLTQVKALSPTDVWAGGATSSDAQAIMLHWDGTSWTQTTLPNPSNTMTSNVTAIGASSATNAWAVGTYANTSFDDGTLSWHLQNSAWSAVTVPNDQGAPYTALEGVDSRSPLSTFAVGWYQASNQSGAPLVLSWSGGKWKQATTPTPAASDFSHLLAVNVLTASNAWAVGAYNNTATGGKAGPYILHWNGTSWKKVKSPN
jgi:hypothetical protein